MAIIEHARDQGAIRWGVLALASLSWIFSYLSVQRCSFFMSGEKNIPDQLLHAYGLFNIPVYENDEPGEHNFKGCVPYPSSTLFSREMNTARGFSVILMLIMTCVLLSLISVQCFVSERKYNSLLFNATRSMIICALVSQLLVFIAFGDDEFCSSSKITEKVNHKDNAHDGVEPGMIMQIETSMKCVPGAAGIIAIFNAFIQIFMFVLICLVPPPKNPVFIVRRYPIQDEYPIQGRYPIQDKYEKQNDCEMHYNHQNYTCTNNNIMYKKEKEIKEQNEFYHNMVGEITREGEKQINQGQEQSGNRKYHQLYQKEDLQDDDLTTDIDSWNHQEYELDSVKDLEMNQIFHKTNRVDRINTNAIDPPSSIEEENEKQHVLKENAQKDTSCEVTLSDGSTDPPSRIIRKPTKHTEQYNSASIAIEEDMNLCPEVKNREPQSSSGRYFGNVGNSGNSIGQEKCNRILRQPGIVESPGEQFANEKRCSEVIRHSNGSKTIKTFTETTNPDGSKTMQTVVEVIDAQELERRQPNNAIVALT